MQDRGGLYGHEKMTRRDPRSPERGVHHVHIPCSAAEYRVQKSAPSGKGSCEPRRLHQQPRAWTHTTVYDPTRQLDAGDVSLFPPCVRICPSHQPWCPFAAARCNGLCLSLSSTFGSASAIPSASATFSAPRIAAPRSADHSCAPPH